MQKSGKNIFEEVFINENLGDLHLKELGSAYPKCCEHESEDDEFIPLNFLKQSNNCRPYAYSIHDWLKPKDTKLRKKVHGDNVPTFTHNGITDARDIQVAEKNSDDFLEKTKSKQMMSSTQDEESSTQESKSSGSRRSNLNEKKENYFGSEKVEKLEDRIGCFENGQLVEKADNNSSQIANDIQHAAQIKEKPESEVPIEKIGMETHLESNESRVTGSTADIQMQMSVKEKNGIVKSEKESVSIRESREKMEKSSINEQAEFFVNKISELSQSSNEKSVNKDGLNGKGNNEKSEMLKRSCKARSVENRTEQIELQFNATDENNDLLLHSEQLAAPQKDDLLHAHHIGEVQYDENKEEAPVEIKKVKRRGNKTETKNLQMTGKDKDKGEPVEHDENSNLKQSPEKPEKKENIAQIINGSQLESQEEPLIGENEKKIAAISEVKPIIKEGSKRRGNKKETRNLKMTDKDKGQGEYIEHDENSNLKESQEKPEKEENATQIINGSQLESLRKEDRFLSEQGIPVKKDENQEEPLIGECEQQMGAISEVKPIRKGGTKRRGNKKVTENFENIERDLEQKIELLDSVKDERSNDSKENNPRVTNGQELSAHSQEGRVEGDENQEDILKNNEKLLKEKVCLESTTINARESRESDKDLEHSGFEHHHHSNVRDEISKIQSEPEKDQNEQISPASHSQVPNEPSKNRSIEESKQEVPLAHESQKEEKEEPYPQLNHINEDPSNGFNEIYDEEPAISFRGTIIPVVATENTAGVSKKENRKFSPFDSEKEFFQFAFYRRCMAMTQRHYPILKNINTTTFITPTSYHNEENPIFDHIDTHNVVLWQNFTAGKKHESLESKASRIDLVDADKKADQKTVDPHTKNHLSKNHLNIRFDDWTIVFYDFIGIMTLSERWKNHKSLPFKKIFDYYRRPSFFTIQHLSISTFSLRKIECGKDKLPIEPGMELMFSDFVVARIVEVRNEMSPVKLTEGEIGADTSKLTEEERACLTYLLLYENIDIKGIDPKSLIDSQNLEDFEIKYLDKVKSISWEKELPISIPYVKIESRAKTEGGKNKVLFIADRSETIKLGRAANSDVILKHNYCSRQHAEITYDREKKKWIFTDGQGKKPSKKGSFVNLTTIEEKAEDMESKFYPLKPGMTVKITDALELKFQNNKLQEYQEKIHQKKLYFG